MQKQNTIATKSSFEQALMAGLIGEEDMHDFYREERLNILEAQYDKRSGFRSNQPDRAFSPQFVLQQAAARYFEMVDGALLTLQGMFTVDEMLIILNCTNSPILSLRYGLSFVNFIADEHGIYSLEQLRDGSTIKLLFLKLMDLRYPQSVALMDLCERFWRKPPSGSISEMCEKLGMKLAEEA